MNKYIDADKLIAEIDKRLSIFEHGIAYECWASCKKIVDSLQQEQSEVDEDFFFAEVLKVYDNNNKYPPRSEEELTMLETVARHFYDLGCRHAAAMYDDIEFERQRRSEEEPTIKGWVARGAMPRDLGFYTGDKPQRMKGGYAPYWSPINGNVYELPDEIGEQFPIEFEDEPIEVKLQIKRI